jgi:hypothetical protein
MATGSGGGNESRTTEMVRGTDTARGLLRSGASPKRLCDSPKLSEVQTDATTPRRRAEASPTTTVGRVDQLLRGFPMRTPRETEQPNRADLLYWAEGLSGRIRGALRRAIDAVTAQPVTRGHRPSAFAGPAAPAILSPFATTVSSTRSPRTCGVRLLRQQLSALSRDHLLTLIDAIS